MGRIAVYKRKAIYEIALADMKAYIKKFPNFCMGLCNCISTAATKSGYTKSYTSAYDYMGSYYPEIWKHKPESKVRSTYWFLRDVDGGAKRIKILENAIEDCNLLIEKSV